LDHEGIISAADFPAGFLWGVATSAYQIEGAVDQDGRGESIWDRFAATPGKIADGSTGARACEHYRRYGEDVAIMRDLGLRAYRFSVAWPRVMPAGRGAVNEAGMAFYDRLVDTLLEAGIAPVATLYHWDLPQALEDQGGWLSRATAEAFVEYAQRVVRRLGDRVNRWITHNEPWCAAMLGYGEGIHAPGQRDLGGALAASHHLLLSHGWAVPVIRQDSRGAEVGIVLNLTPVAPASPSAADARACARVDGASNRWYLDPIFGRGYPADVLAQYQSQGVLPSGTLLAERAGDQAVLAAPCDFLGINYYSRAVVRAAEQSPSGTELVPPRGPCTDIGWEIYPAGLRELLIRVQRDYGPRRIYITENGASYATAPDGSGRVRDQARVRYLAAHLRAAREAIQAGVPLAGYFVWSLLDNFEWAYGYSQRFGIVWVDFETQRRVLKDSAHYLRDVVLRGA
jgi:beta-glucosidase